MSYKQLQETAKSKSQRKSPSIVPPLWSQQKIPPLVSISLFKQKQTDKISIQSLNQSEVRSIYTVDREETDKHTLELFRHVFPANQNDQNQAKLAIGTKQKSALNLQNSNIKQTKINDSPQIDIEVQYQTTQQQRIESYQLSNCAAVKLFNDLVKMPDQRRDGPTVWQWLNNKTASEIIANVAVSSSRARLYVHYLMKQINQNQMARTVNQLYGQNIRNYNPTLTANYSAIVCLLSKLLNTKQKQDSFRKYSNKTEVKTMRMQSSPSISLFQNGISIDVDPALSQIKKQNNDRIHNLRRQISQQQLTLLQTKKIYEQIIHNYAATIQNVHKVQDGDTLHPPLQQSRVQMHLQMQDQQDAVRLKNHTFGNQFSQRSSRQ